ncbi:GNAT family N-acetyltransferase [Streptomyces radicis]|uniref:GNAT family N-acetyltransferase n=1 Tax=Streptomyces radicis TaxID=1750517 RepID=A0A3A9VZK0_9ACTN|nr:GNAT family N-acetyltransferase [Streptomyces radicis]RKN06445.1 GNAT family N-acetyltransferase [Streptomyces radicis]RKN20296.1 GNAT family N-acetyltransferase [Streptomyces radicis]
MAISPELARVHAFLTGFARRQAPRVAEVPGGFAVRDDALRYSHHDNQLFIDAPVEPAALPGLADEALNGLAHRLITVLDDGLGQACVPALTGAGYTHEANLLMLHTGPVPRAGAAEPVELAAFAEPLSRRWRGFLPHADDEAVRQLVERRTARHRGAATVHFIGARTSEGEVASWADLYLEPALGIGQFEDFLTAERHLGKGYGTAVLTTALHLASAAGCATRFLVASEDDWPRHWYARRGFTAIGRTHTFERG